MIELVRGLVCLDLVRQADGPPAFIDEVDHLTYRSFPATQRAVHVLLLLYGDDADVQQPHWIGVRLNGPDGPREFPEARTRFATDEDDEGGPLYLTASLSFLGARFERPGDYEFQIDLDGRPLGRLPLLVEKLAAAA